MGKKCLINCYLQGKKTQVLWDTGSQVSAIDEVWKADNLPNVKLRDRAEIIDPNDPLQIEAANGTEMPYVGWVEVTFRLADGTEEFHVPMLVMKGSQQPRRIVGFSVIARVVINNQVNQTNDVEGEKLIKTAKMAFPNLKKKTVKAVLSVEWTGEYQVRTACQRMSIPSHSAVQVKCRIHAKPLKEDTTWPEGLDFCDTLVQARKGAQPNIILSVQNPTDHHHVNRKDSYRYSTVSHICVSTSAVKEAYSPVDLNNIQAKHTKDQETSIELWDPPPPHWSQSPRWKSEEGCQWDAEGGVKLLLLIV